MSIEDKLAIQQAIANYSYTFDSGDAEGWASVFTKDGVWEFFAAGQENPSIKLEGHDALRQFAEQRNRDKPEGVSSYHHQSGILFDELTADTARTRAMLILTAQSAGERSAHVSITGVYYDQWRKTPEGWRLVYRALKA